MRPAQVANRVAPGVACELQITGQPNKARVSIVSRQILKAMAPARWQNDFCYTRVRCRTHIAAVELHRIGDELPQIDSAGSRAAHPRLICVDQCLLVSREAAIAEPGIRPCCLLKAAQTAVD